MHLLTESCMEDGHFEFQCEKCSFSQSTCHISIEFFNLIKFGAEFIENLDFLELLHSKPIAKTSENVTYNCTCTLKEL